MKTIRFFALLLGGILLISPSLFSQNWNGGIKGEGPKVKKQLSVNSFDGLSMTINATVYLKQGSSQSVEIEAQQNIIDNIEREVRDGIWKISFDKNVRSHDGVKIWITMKDLKKIAVSGSGDVIGENAFKGIGNLELYISGSGDIQLNSDSKSVNASISGSGDMKLGGRTGDCELSITGSGDISAFDLVSDHCSVKITGSGDSSVYVNEKLEVAIVGSGDVYYKGKANVRSRITGSGDVVSK